MVKTSIKNVPLKHSKYKKNSRNLIGHLKDSLKNNLTLHYYEQNSKTLTLFLNSSKLDFIETSLSEYNIPHSEVIEEDTTKNELNKFKILSDRKNFKFVEVVFSKVIIHNLFSKYKKREVFDENTFIYFESLNLAKESKKEDFYISNTSQWYSEQKKFLSAYSLNDRNLVPELSTTAYNKRLMGDYVLTSNISGKKEISLYDIKNYEGLPFSFYQQFNNIKKSMNTKTDIDLNSTFSKTSEPNLQLLHIMDVGFFQEYLEKKITQNYVEEHGIYLEEVDSDIKDKISIFNSYKEKLMSYSEEIFENYEDLEEASLTMDIEDDLFIYELIKLFENGYLSNLYSINGYSINKHLVTVSDDTGNLQTNIKLVDLKRIKNFIKNSKKQKIKLQRIKGYLYFTIFVDNKPIYNFSFRKGNSKKNLTPNACLINNDFLITKSTLNQEETLDLINKPNLHLPDTKNEDIIELIKQETFDLNIPFVSKEKIINKYLQVFGDRLFDLYKIYSQIPDNTKDKIVNVYDNEKFRKLIIYRLNQDLNPYFSEMLSKHNFSKQTRENGEVIFMYNGEKEEFFQECSNRSKEKNNDEAKQKKSRKRKSKKSEEVKTSSNKN